MRHTAASKMIEARIDLVTASKILAHSKIEITMRYCHPTPDNMQRAVDKLGEVFEKSSQNAIVDYRIKETKNLSIPTMLNN